MLAIWIKLTGNIIIYQSAKMTPLLQSSSLGLGLGKKGINILSTSLGGWRICRIMSIMNSKLLKKESLQNHTGRPIITVPSGVARPGECCVV